VLHPVLLILFPWNHGIKRHLTCGSGTDSPFCYHSQPPPHPLAGPSSLIVPFSCGGGNLRFSSSSISIVTAWYGVHMLVWPRAARLNCVAECSWDHAAVKTSDEIKAWMITKCLPSHAASLLTASRSTALRLCQGHLPCCHVCTAQSRSMGQFGGDRGGFKLGSVKQEYVISVAVGD